MSRSTRLLLAATLAGGATLVPAVAAQADGGSFSCSATALGGTVLGQPLATPAVAGGAGACRTSEAAGALPAALGAGAIFARTGLTGADVLTQRATATAGVGELALGGLESLSSLIPVPALPAGLGAVTIPLPQVALPAVPLPELPAVPEVPTAPIPVPELPAVPGVGGLTGIVAPVVTTATTTLAPDVTSALPSLPTGSALPTSITLDVRRAVEDLLPNRLLPQLDLLRMTAATTSASARCAGGVPVLEGASTLAGVRVLGQDLDVTKAVDDVVSLLSAQTVSLAGIDLTKIELPAGLSFADPLLGPVLRDAVTTALAALPPLDLAAVVARVQVTPGSQERGADTLVQRGPRIAVQALGRELLDVALGGAQVGSRGVDCSPEAPLSAAAVPTVAPASQLALECGDRKVTLVDVTETSGHVSLLGAADAANVGRKVAIVFSATGKKVAEGVVRPDGFFRAQAPLPAKGMRSSDKARYMAVLDGDRSLNLKLQRRMRISRMSNLGEQIRITGKITGPLAKGQEIVIRRQVSCTKDVVVKRFTPTKVGTWRVTVPAPTVGQAASYRATTMVLGSTNAENLFPTFTLPGYVSL